MALFEDLTFLYVAGDLDGVVNSSAFTLSFWFRCTGSDMVVYNAEGRVRLRIRSSGGLNFKADNTSNVSVIEIETGSTYNDGEWHHALISGDYPNSTLMVDGVSDIEVVRHIPGEIQFAIGGFSDHGLGAVVQSQMGDPADNYNGDLEDFYLNISESVGVSAIESFYHNGRVEFGENGERPLSTLPIIYFSEDWSTARGTGGPWVTSGTVQDSASPPPVGWSVPASASASWVDV